MGFMRCGGITKNAVVCNRHKLPTSEVNLEKSRTNAFLGKDT